MAFDTDLFLDAMPGESTAAFAAKPNGHSEIPSEIFSFSLGASNPASVGPSSGGLSAGRVSVSSFNLMKKTDNLSPLLFQACCNGQHIKKATIVLRKAAGKDGKQSVFLEYDFDDCMIESIQWSGSSGGDDTPTESISIAFAKIAVTYQKQDTVTGITSKGNGALWDLTTVE